MKTEERDNFIKLDKIKREKIIKSSISKVFENNININSINNVKETRQYFQNNFEKYIGNMLTQEKYKPSDFWFNDAGFQFKWRNFESTIQLECLTWNEVYKIVKELQ